MNINDWINGLEDRTDGAAEGKKKRLTYFLQLQSVLPRWLKAAHHSQEKWIKVKVSCKYVSLILIVLISFQEQLLNDNTDFVHSCLPLVAHGKVGVRLEGAL